MVDTVIEQQGVMTITEFVRLYETEGPFEVINEERRPLSPGVWVHIFMIRAIVRLLDPYVQTNQLGEIFSEMLFVLTYGSNWVKGAWLPDIMFVRAERIRIYQTEVPDYPGKPLILVPDLVIEVISPNDHYSEVEEKIERYLADGVEQVWIFDPRQKSVTVRGRDLFKKLYSSDTLMGGDIIPGFETPVKAIFE